MVKKKPSKKATEKAVPAKAETAKAETAKPSTKVSASTLDAMKAEIKAAKPEKEETFIDVLVPEGSVAPRLRIRQLRRATKYLCSRMRTEADGGVEAPELPDGFREFYETQEWFDGWDMYNTSWDVEQVFDEKMKPIVTEFRPLELIPRWESVWEEWDQVIDAHVKGDVIAARKRKRMGTAPVPTSKTPPNPQAE